MGWFEDFFDDTLDVVADAVVGVSSAAIDTAVKARQAGVVFPPGEAVADFWDVDMEDAVSAAESQGQYLTDEDVDVNVNEELDEVAHEDAEYVETVDVVEATEAEVDEPVEAALETVTKPVKVLPNIKATATGRME
ncbi:hypothetical protein [Anaerovibrio slackiae]|uniref:hypothetical protein n=1 Tax=Anaerovibrio slackiae TaxID=2652309 RepID=UPI0038668CEE